MSPLCKLGWHRISQNVRWNRGYYFSRCERCGRDLVRTIYGRWHEPRGYRVVWQAAAPPCPGPTPPHSGGRPGLPIQHVLDRLKYDQVGLAQSTSAASGGGSALGAGRGAPGKARRAELLEQSHGTCPRDVQQGQPLTQPSATVCEEEQPGPLARAGTPVPVAFHEPGQADGPPGDGGGAVSGGTPAPVSLPATWVPEEEAAPKPMPETATAPDSAPVTGSVTATEQAPDSALRAAESHSQDFMAGDEGESAWESLLNSPNAASASNTTGTSARFYGKDVQGSVPAAFNGLLGQLGRLAASARRNGWSQLRRLVWLNLKEADISPATATLAGLAGGAAVSILAGVFAISLLLVRGSEHRTAPVQAVNIRPSVATTGYVTASLLNCRTAPAREAGVARRLSRGEEIDILASDAGWASVGFRGRQCWVQGRYISLVRPLRVQ